jgi:hypothetical protein
LPAGVNSASHHYRADKATQGCGQYIRSIPSSPNNSGPASSAISPAVPQPRHAEDAGAAGDFTSWRRIRRRRRITVSSWPGVSTMAKAHASNPSRTLSLPRLNQHSLNQATGKTLSVCWATGLFERFLSATAPNGPKTINPTCLNSTDWDPRNYICTRSDKAAVSTKANRGKPSATGSP